MCELYLNSETARGLEELEILSIADSLCNEQEKESEVVGGPSLTTSEFLLSQRTCLSTYTEVASAHPDEVQHLRGCGSNGTTKNSMSSATS